jgi:hypothetical protein
MGGSSSKKKDEAKRRASIHERGGEGEKDERGEKGKFGYEEMLSKEPAEVGGKIQQDNIGLFITKLLRDDEISIRRVLVYCNYILSGMF